MIADALEFLQRTLQSALSVDDDVVFVERVQSLQARRGICLTLINALNDQAFRQAAPASRDPVAALSEATDATTLQIVCAFAGHSYHDDLRLLSQTMAWVRRTPMYRADSTDTSGSNALPAGIDSLIVEVMDLRLDELQDVWTTLAHPLLPSAVLRMRILHRTPLTTNSSVKSREFERTTPRIDGVRAWRRVPDATGDWRNVPLDAVDRNTMEVLAATLSQKHSVGRTALFDGTSSDAKALAAALLGRDAARPVYRIDLSAVVSKYIGETEKNLSALFDEVAGTGAILFFDEADALFGKRTNVRDASDRYANQEVSYFLERIEAHDGLTIIATERRAHLDEAFLRRMRSIIRFPAT